MSKIKGLSQKEQEAVNAFREKINRDYQVVAFKLFGSKARGDFRKNSDIDILLVVKKVSEKDKDKIYGLVNSIFFKYGIDLSVKIFSQKEYDYLNSIPSVFMQFIQREGVSL